MVTHYESLQEGAVDGTPPLGHFFGFGSAANQALLSKVATIWFFSARFLGTYEHNGCALRELARGCR
jgi:hypothetical protein